MAKGKSSAIETILEFDDEAIKARELEVAKESDEQIIERLRERFEMLTEMTRAVKSGQVRAMIVSGPPGVGKSFGVEEVLSKDGLFDTIAQRKPKFEVVKGAMSALGLYAKLHEFSDEKCVLVFDDCDTVLMDELSLNILKGALDSNKKRVIAWNTDSRLLRSESIPSSFEFKGSAIFITNIKFEHVRSKKLRAHLDALESRCHYIDLQMDTNREKILRIRQIVDDGMLADRDMDQPAQDEVVDFIVENQNKIRELSLRMVLKIADLRQGFPTTWQKMAQQTCMRRT
jgi:hypothetical protein